MKFGRKEMMKKEMKRKVCKCFIKIKKEKNELFKLT
jgi:hypothetical protein